MMWTHNKAVINLNKTCFIRPSGTKSCLIFTKILKAMYMVLTVIFHFKKGYFLIKKFYFSRGDAQECVF